jgi:hypothetical protein
MSLPPFRGRVVREDLHGSAGMGSQFVKDCRNACQPRLKIMKFRIHMIETPSQFVVTQSYWLGVCLKLGNCHDLMLTAAGEYARPMPDTQAQDTVWADRIFLAGAIIAGICFGVICVDSLTGGKVTDWLTRQAPRLASVTPIRAQDDRDAS